MTHRSGVLIGSDSVAGPFPKATHSRDRVLPEPRPGPRGPVLLARDGPRNLSSFSDECCRLPISSLAPRRTRSKRLLHGRILSPCALGLCFRCSLGLV